MFLLALASGTRLEEIHVLDLSSRIRWADDSKKLILRPYREFMAKTNVDYDPSTVVTGFRIQA